jgi:predicted transcriptional regulator
MRLIYCASSALISGHAMSAALTIRFEDEARLAELDALSRATDRSRNWLINRAIDQYLVLQSWQVAKIEAGIAAGDRTDFASDAEVEAAFTDFGRSA